MRWRVVTLYNPENFRRKSRDPAQTEGGAAPGQEEDGGASLSVSALAVNPVRPVFERQPAPGPRSRSSRLGDPAPRRASGAHLSLVPGSAPTAVLDRSERLSRLFCALEDLVIPGLLRYHPAPGRRVDMKPSEAEFEDFFACLLQDDETGFVQTIDRMRDRGLSLESVFMDVFVPAALRMGDRWCDDASDFVAVTVAVGQLQRLVQRYGAEFCAEGHPTAAGHRILLIQPDVETHNFGLSLVAEFFRRDGWDVVIALAGSGLDPDQRVEAEWFDAAGVSTGSHLLLPGLRERIAGLRRQSLNPGMLVMVGGPLFSADPSRVGEVGADLTADARQAPGLVLQLLAARDAQVPRRKPSS
jgi:methanogenic corrinoid protein MtbC1